VKQHPMNRREFARRSIATIATAGAMSEAVSGDETPPVEARRPRPADRDRAAAANIEDHLLEVIRRRYPDPRLNPDVLQAIRRDLAGDVQRSGVLNSYVLQNSDEPGFVFAAYRSDTIR
jgi:hypothetical protein